MLFRKGEEPVDMPIHHSIALNIRAISFQVSWAKSAIYWPSLTGSHIYHQGTHHTDCCISQWGLDLIERGRRGFCPSSCAIFPNRSGHRWACLLLRPMCSQSQSVNNTFPYSLVNNTLKSINSLSKATLHWMEKDHLMAYNWFDNLIKREGLGTYRNFWLDKGLVEIRHSQHPCSI